LLRSLDEPNVSSSQFISPHREEEEEGAARTTPPRPGTPPCSLRQEQTDTFTDLLRAEQLRKLLLPEETGSNLPECG